jgi:hypothetical protein
VSLKRTLTLEIEGRDEPVTVTYNALDIRRWEADTGRSYFAGASTLEQFTWLGWAAAVRQGLIDGELKDVGKFLEACTDLDIRVPGAEDDRPTSRRATRKGRGDG